jgi:hypothetical protein
MNIKDFLSFRKMVTPLIIQVIFWIGVGLCVIAGLVEIVTGAPSRLGGLVTLLLGPILVRIWCELVIVAFRINETLTDIRKNTEKPGPP